jgi:CTD small phosphatase-like protein 2
MNKLYEVIIFTAGEEYYAKQIIDVLDPEEKLISARLYRDSCTEHN